MREENAMPSDQGYDFEEVNVQGRGDVDVRLSYANAHDVLLDGLLNELGSWQITEANAGHVAATLLDLLVDADEVIQGEELQED